MTELHLYFSTHRPSLIKQSISHYSVAFVWFSLRHDVFLERTLNAQRLQPSCKGSYHASQGRIECILLARHDSGTGEQWCSNLNWRQKSVKRRNKFIINLYLSIWLRQVKNCYRGLCQFFTIRTDPKPDNNMFVFFFLR